MYIYTYVFDLHPPSLTRLLVDSLLVCCLCWWYFPQVLWTLRSSGSAILSCRWLVNVEVFWIVVSLILGWFRRSLKQYLKSWTTYNSVIDFRFVKEKRMFNFRYFVKSWFASMLRYDSRNESWIAEKDNVMTGAPLIPTLNEKTRRLLFTCSTR